jgi:hypothetical protein
MTSLTGIAPPGIEPVAYLPPNRAIQTIELTSSQKPTHKGDFLKANGFQRFSKWARNILAKAPLKLVKSTVQDSMASTPSRPAPELPPRSCRPYGITTNTSSCSTHLQGLSVAPSISEKAPPLPPRPAVAHSPPLHHISPVYVDSGSPTTRTGDSGRGMLLESIRKTGIGDLRKVAHRSNYTSHE